MAEKLKHELLNGDEKETVRGENLTEEQIAVLEEMHGPFDPTVIAADGHTLGGHERQAQKGAREDKEEDER